MKLNYYGTLVIRVAILSTVAAITSQALDITIIESRSPGTNVAWYAEAGGNWANSSAKSTAPGVTPAIGSRFATAEAAAFSVSPVLQDGATYTVDITHGESSSIPNTLDAAVTVVGGTMSVTNTGVFARFPQNVWERVGTLALDAGITTPTVTFRKMTPGTTSRFYADAVRFTLLEPCLTVPDLTTVNGPLAAGQAYVDVPITNTAQAITVYADGVQIGQKTSGIAVGVNRITTSPLVKGQVITATQTQGGIESCKPTAGQFVGSGPNPAVSIAITIRQTNLTDSVIGVNGGAPGSILKLIGATNVVGTLLAPLGAKLFYPSNEWQTVQFQRGDDPANPIDPTYNWNAADGTFGNQLGYNFGVFDALIFTSPQDTGPFAIYIDEFRNGDTLVQGFENAALGQSAPSFTQPGTSGTTVDFLLAKAPGTINPNISMVTNNVSDGGAHSMFVSWQFNSINIASCLRLAAVSGTVGSTPNPIVDLRLPISFRMLILPVGQLPPPLAADAVTGPADQRAIPGGSVTMRFTYRGTAPFRFQWRHNGTDIPNATNATYTVTNAQVSDGGSYTVVVSNSLGSDESAAGILTVEDVPFTDIMTPAWTLANGSRPYLANDNNTRSIACSPLTGNLLVASRSGNSNAIYVLDGNTGAFLHTLEPPAERFTGGTLVLNQVAVANDGTVYAGNLTTDGATTDFKLYQWFGDYAGEPGFLLWHGNPAGNPDVHLRWGDAITVGGEAGASEVLVSSSGTLLAIITDFPSLLTVDVTNAPATGFRLGLAAANNSVWGKMTGLPLLQAQVDENSFSGTVLNSFSGLNTMSAIGVNTNGTLLAGVFVDNPDHLRLFDISTPGSITALDTELFPSDNANVNATGAVAFGNGKVYALDSNNGIIAMNLNADCLPDRLAIEPSGTDVILRWNRATYHLEGTTTLGSGWATIAGSSPKTLPATGNQFFRLVCP